MSTEQEQIESATAAEAEKLLAGEDWASARVVMAEVGSNSSAMFRFARADGTTGSLSPRLVARHLRGLRTAMADADRGCWFSVTVDLDREDAAPRFAYNWDRRVDYGHLAFDGLALPDVAPTRPDADQWLDELRRHPRSPEHVPAWLRALVAGEGTELQPGDGAAIERAIAAAPTWPPARASLASSTRWSEVFNAVSEEIVRALRADTPATELLHREVDDRALEQVAASATGPLLRRFVHDTASCGALAAELDTPNGPDRAEDDVTDAITDLVDWQVARRFDR
ncbi:hypothetical protein QP735_09485 [Curtobacterium citreum]|uniref:hypothetical protein n=1 Tax=Curtobacterium citreum TaxID=2036 RepID=UPI0025511962|nr:hypothetical protein [Curtobacterium citreum]MDK8172760.1 hypothetical protein [Curtobacterium citreum]